MKQRRDRSRHTRADDGYFYCRRLCHGVGFPRGLRLGEMGREYDSRETQMTLASSVRREIGCAKGADIELLEYLLPKSFYINCPDFQCTMASSRQKRASEARKNSIPAYNVCASVRSVMTAGIQ
jgi:hypothetical protein